MCVFECVCLYVTMTGTDMIRQGERFTAYKTVLLISLIVVVLPYLLCVDSWLLQQIELKKLLQKRSLSSVDHIGSIRIEYDDSTVTVSDVDTITAFDDALWIRLQQDNLYIYSNKVSTCLYVLSDDEALHRIGCDKTGSTHSPSPTNSPHSLPAPPRGGGQGSVRFVFSERESGGRAIQRQLLPSRFGSGGGRGRQVYFNPGRLYDRGVADIKVSRFTAVKVEGQCHGTRFQCHM
eukprot:GHVQ01009690.1.p1 GENE.GHVQ01009690.1~~GHVQ01009690.1.p1  ORF type:complete len:235 (-),score=43.35 GHVQ01009690.1:92-796(-)